MANTERQQKIAKLRESHQPYFDMKNMSDAYFIPKMAYKPSGKSERHLSFFPSELKKGGDIFTEFVSRGYDSEDPTRTLYLKKHNPYWEQEYEINVSSTGFTTYLVPISELIPLNTLEERNNIKKTFNTVLPTQLPDPEKAFSTRAVVVNLDRIATALEEINKTLNKK